jgi:hypothetical protein
VHLKFHTSSAESPAAVPIGPSGVSATVHEWFGYLPVGAERRGCGSELSEQVALGHASTDGRALTSDESPFRGPVELFDGVFSAQRRRPAGEPFQINQREWAPTTCVLGTGASPVFA